MDANDVNPLYNDPQQNVFNVLTPSKPVLQIADPLTIDIPDDELEKIVDRRIKDSQQFFEEQYNLTERRKKNETYLFGRQIAQKEKQGLLKDYETRSADNVLWEIESSLKPLAMSKLPDLIVTPGGKEQERIESAKDITIVVNDVNKQREQQELLGIAFKHLPVYFTAIIKARWNSEKGLDGDYEFCNIRPEYIVVDHTCSTKKAEDMSFIAQCVPMTVQEAVMKFPSKKDALFKELQRQGIMVGQEPTWKDMASEVKVWEVWFDWYKKKTPEKQLSSPDGDVTPEPDEVFSKSEMQSASVLEPGVTWEKICGVLWKYEHVILDKMLDPNFDHIGEEKTYLYTIPGDETTKQEVEPMQLMLASISNTPIPGLVKEQVYHNYFQKPQKPYYFMGYDQWGKVYLDETSRIEQNIRNQENLDDQNKTIIDQLKTRVKHIWGGESGLKKADIQRLDMDNPKLDVRVEGDPNSVHKAIEPERPDAAQFNALSDTRSRMYAISGSNAIRGQLQSSVATSNQIAREGDFTRNDDVVQDTINAACEWMADWQLHFIKLRYTDDHLKEILGPKGDTTYIRLRRDSIADGMEVRIKASSTDKLKAQRNAMDTAKLGPPFSNPWDFFNDMDMADPEGRTERGMMMMLDPQGFYTKYVMGMQNVGQMAAALNGAPTPTPGGASPTPAPAAPAPTPPMNPTPQNTSSVPTDQPTFPEGSPRAL